MNMAKELAQDLKSGLDRWRVSVGGFRCPECSSKNVARELTRTEYYPARTVVTERLIRCLDCDAEVAE